MIFPPSVSTETEWVPNTTNREVSLNTLPTLSIENSMQTLHVQSRTPKLHTGENGSNMLVAQMCGTYTNTWRQTQPTTGDNISPIWNYWTAPLPLQTSLRQKAWPTLSSPWSAPSTGMSTYLRNRTHPRPMSSSSQYFPLIVLQTH